MKINFGYSPCPNDTFIFAPLVNGKITDNDIELIPYLADVQELNQLVLSGELPLSKMSYHAWLHASKQYMMLESGGALGRNCGPLLISKRKIYPDEVKLVKIAIPGEHTTANLLMSIAFPEAKQKKSYLFSEIEEVILSEEADAGVIIHENRFTYKQKGLKLIMDLGEYWENEYKFPIPLGTIAIRRDFPQEILQKVNQLIFRSIEYAMSHPEESMDYVKKHAQTMSESVMLSHINLYVSKYTQQIGDDGKDAIQKLIEVATANALCEQVTKPYFV